MLVSGFGPFLAHATNPSAILAAALDGAWLEDVSFSALAPLPVAYSEAARQTIAAAQNADAILALGLADTAQRVRLERRALNLTTSEHADIRGVIQRGPIYPHAPAQYETHVALDAVQTSLRAEGVDSEFSESAGGYVCNDLFFRLLHAADRREICRPILFVHVPPDAHTDVRLPQALGRAFIAGVRGF